jgi:hypothetical protein
MILVGLLLAAVSIFIIQHLPSSYFSSNSTVMLTPATIQQFASFVVGGLGAFGLISGIIVLTSAVMLQANPSKRRTWGVLILVFSVLSFLGTGGLVVGAILGIAGGVMALTWKPPTQ